MKWVSASDLEQWAERLDARANLPELIRRLIHATVTVERLDFPSGEGVQRPGWDGLAKAHKGNQFVPPGVSGWECSCKAKISANAESCYKTRTANRAGLDECATFVYATPRRWQSKREWIESKRGLAQWADVRALDADDLEQWLELAPSVAAWLAGSIGKVPSEAAALDDWWRDWAQSTQPTMAPKLLTAGRAEAAQKIRDWLSAPPRVLALEADTHQEAIAFLAAVIALLPEAEAQLWWSRSLCLVETASARELQTGSEPLLLVLPGSPDLIPQALAKHHVLLALARGVVAGRVDIQLAFSKKPEFQTALESMGIAAEDASRLAHDVGCSVPVLRRRLARAVSPAPAWAQPGAARPILPALLAGSWDEARAGDKALLAELAGEPYDAFVGRLQGLLNSPDPPLRSSGSAWKLTSDRDAFFLLARFITATDLDRFQAACVKVLAAPDPKSDLEPSQRWMAAVYGKDRAHSARLRQGLASTLALIAVFGEAAGLQGTFPTADRTAAIVTNLLDQADARRWVDIADVLPILAEASPDAFLSAAEASLDSPKPSILALFEETPTPFTASAGHTHLLWALEGLAWDPRLLGRVALILARLDRLDPGGKLANRPAATLRDIFLFWMPQTSASLSQRHCVLEVLLAREQTVAWELLLALAPHSHEFCTPNYKPRWRDHSAVDGVTIAEWQAAVAWLAERSSAAAGSDGKRWARLVDACPGFPPHQRQAIWGRLAQISQSPMSDKKDLWSALRRSIGQHRRFHDAQWAIPSAEVDALVPIYEALTPADPITALSWLFDHNPAIPDPPKGWQDHAAFDAIADKQRRDAIREILGINGTAGIIALAREAPQPWMVGIACGNALPEEGVTNRLLELLLASHEDSLRAAARALVASAMCEKGWAWVDARIAAAKDAHWPDEKTVELLLGLPFEMSTWDRAAALGPAIDARYWAKTGVFGKVSGHERHYAIHKLLEADRPLVALGTASMAEEPVQAELLIRIAEDIPKHLVSRAEPAGNLDAFHLERLFEMLDHQGAATDVVARLEFPYLNLLTQWKRHAALHEAIATDPKFFAELIQLIYRPTEDDDRLQPTAEDIARAHSAHTLLSSWHGMPCRTRDGRLDGNQLMNWVSQARELCASAGRARIGDQKIGEILARAQSGDDGIWPALPVREIIESSLSQGLETGVEVGVANLRGAHCRGLDDGGAQERVLVTQYRVWAGAAASAWPRTSAVLARIADDYEQLGAYHDQRSEQAGWEL